MGSTAGPATWLNCPVSLCNILSPHWGMPSRFSVAPPHLKEIRPKKLCPLCSGSSRLSSVLLPPPLGTSEMALRDGTQPRVSPSKLRKKAFTAERYGSGVVPQLSAVDAFSLRLWPCFSGNRHELLDNAASAAIYLDLAPYYRTGSRQQVRTSICSGANSTRDIECTCPLLLPASAAHSLPSAPA